MYKHKKALLSLSALFLSFLSTAYADIPLFSNGRLIQPPPGANVAAAYFTVANTGDQPLVFNSVSSAAVSNATLHLSSVVDDVARMEEQASITIDAGESLEFKQGSYHVMLMGLIEPLIAGNEFSFSLDTNQGPIHITIPVITPDEATAMDEMANDATAHDKMNRDDADHKVMNHDEMTHDDADRETMDHDDSTKKELDVK